MASSTVASAYTKFIYHEPLLVLELDGLDSDAVLRKYTWGRDLSGTLGGAGGIGGLLAVYDTGEAAGYVAHSRYVFFQMAEVAVPRELFAAILGRIERLRFRLPRAAVG